MKSLGADRVIDYTTADNLDPGVKYDFSLDAVGKRKISKLKAACRKALTRGGKYVSFNDETLLLDSKRLALIKEMAEAGHIRPIIDRCYQFDEIVEAHRYVGKGHKRGGVAVRLTNKNKNYEKVQFTILKSL